MAPCHHGIVAYRAPFSVATLADGKMPAGKHDVRLAPSDLALGIYLLRFQAGDEVKTGKLARIR
jgi:hypothetical protein